MDQFLGKKYKQVSTENFEDYLKFLEFGLVARKAAQTTSPVTCLEKNPDGTYALSVTSLVKSNTTTFRLDEEFVETRLDGVKVKTTTKMDGNKLIQIQIEDSGRKTTHIREFTPEFLIVTSTTEGWDGKCIRTSKVVE